MDAIAFSAVDFPTGHCSSCERDVLTHTDFDGNGVETRLCVHCDTPLDAEMTKGSALSAYGYDVIEPSSGCGRPDCGNGRCGSSDPPASAS
jgi:hypothetical protein